MWLQPEPAEASIVVSDIGETWSPNNPPDSIEPIVTYKGALSATVIGITIGIIILYVPQELPVENDIIHPRRKAIIGINPEFRFMLFIKWTM